MDYQAIILKATKFIQKHYNDDIQVTDVCEHVYLSPSYFSAVFRTLTGYTVKEYQNLYRLYRAANDLLNSNKNIVTISFENGFSSQQAFTKTFVAKYKTSPAKFRKNVPILNPFPPQNLFKERGIPMELKKSFDNVRFVKKEDFFVIGIESDINYNGIGKGTGYITDLYCRWNGENLIETIPNQVNQKLCYGITHESKEDDSAKYMVCVEVSTLENLPIGLIGRKFPGCEYAVFETTLATETNGEFFRYFFGTWLNEKGFSLPEPVHTKNNNNFTTYPIWEVYDENFKDESSKILIYAPIIK